MIKLKEIIGQLDSSAYGAIEENLVKTKADNFLLLLQSYRNGNSSDKEIMQSLEISQNSYYVLKSRLYDKIQQHLSADVLSTKENIIHQLLELSEVCFNQPREIAIAFLQKLEAELLQFDMHNELQLVYSALKKMHLHSDKYFHYSQLFNKQIALGLSLEKAEEVLGNFNRILGQYDFSRSIAEYERLSFLKKEIVNTCVMNPSRQIEIIKNIVELQLTIFGPANPAGSNAADLLDDTRKLFAALPETSSQKKWELALDYLCFEYFLSIGEYRKAEQYYVIVNSHISTFLLYNNICLSSAFLLSKIRFCYETGRAGELNNADAATIQYDVNDGYSKVMLGIYHSMLSFEQKDLKAAISKLNEILNIQSFKDYFHGNINVKLTLAFFYIIAGDFDMVDVINKSISRKIKAEKLDNYRHVLNLIKVFESDMNQDAGSKINAKTKDQFTLFAANNTREKTVLAHLLPVLKKRYA